MRREFLEGGNRGAHQTKLEMRSVKTKVVPIGIGVVLVVGLIAVLSALTGSKAPDNGGSTKSQLVGKHIKDSRSED